MRKALFAVVLVAASFGGGVVVNGPGLRWAQAQLLSRLGYDDGESAAHAAAVALAPGPAVDGEIPSRPIPPLVIDPAAGAPGAAKTSGTAAAANHPAPAAPDEAAGALPGIPPVPEALVQTHDAPVLTPAPPPAALETSHEHERERERAAAELAAATAARARARARPPERDAAVLPVSIANPPDPTPIPAPAPAAPPEPAPEPAPVPAPDPGAIPADPADWAGVRRALRDLGVAHYGIEGEPTGKVRFHCVIPLAGRRAVGQHFEADGDDEFQAARALLRRVALWRASEAPGR